MYAGNSKHGQRTSFSSLLYQFQWIIGSYNLGTPDTTAALVILVILLTFLAANARCVTENGEVFAAVWGVVLYGVPCATWTAYFYCNLLRRRTFGTFCPQDVES